MTEGDTKQPGAASAWSLQPLFSAWPPPTQPSLVVAEKGIGPARNKARVKRDLRKKIELN